MACSAALLCVHRHILAKRSKLVGVVSARPPETRRKYRVAMRVICGWCEHAVEKLAEVHHRPTAWFVWQEGVTELLVLRSFFNENLHVFCFFAFEPAMINMTGYIHTHAAY